MKRRGVRLRGAALLYMLGLLPLIIVITGISTVLIGRLLRVQRESTYRVAYSENAARLIDRMRDDSAAAESVDIKSMDRSIVFENDSTGSKVVYRIDDNVVTRTDAISGGLTDETWRFKHVRIDVELEQLEASTPLLWVQFAYRMELRKKVVNVMGLSTAMRVGGREPKYDPK